MISATDLASPEAPLLLPDGSFLIAELSCERATVKQVVPDGGPHRDMARTDRLNGLALRRDGAVWVCETLAPAVIGLELDGTRETGLSEVEVVPLRWPNDPCFGADGTLDITDSGVFVGEFVDARGVPVPYWADVPVDGAIVRFDPRTGDARILDHRYAYATGIAFGPDARLYFRRDPSPRVLRRRTARPAPTTTGRSSNTFNCSGKGRRTSACGPAGQQRIYVGEYEHGRIKIRGGRRRGPARRIGGAE